MNLVRERRVLRFEPPRKRTMVCMIVHNVLTGAAKEHSFELCEETIVDDCEAAALRFASDLLE